MFHFRRLLNIQGMSASLVGGYQFGFLKGNESETAFLCLGLTFGERTHRTGVGE